MNLNEFISFVFLIISVIVSLVMWVIKKNKKNKVFISITPMKAFTVGFVIALSAYIFLASASDNNILNLIDNGFRTLRSVKKYFKFDFVPSEFNQAVDKESVPVSGFGRCYLTLLNLIIPFITLRVVYSAFRDYLTQWIYFFGRFRKYHIFSDLNEKSLSLAEDIFDNEKRCTIIFSNVSDKYSDGLLERAKIINAHFTNKTILDFVYFKRRNTLYIISDDDFNNMSTAIRINEVLNRRNVAGDVFILSSLESSPEYIDVANLNKNNNFCYANLINYSQLISYNLLFDYPLYKAAEKSNSNKISVLVVGAGFIGMEFAKSSMWAGLMNKYEYEITVIDSKDKEAEFISACGDVNSILKDVGISINYRFEIADVKSAKFKELIREYYDANYIVVALGNDELTADSSVTVRRELIRAAVEKGLYNGTNNSLIISIITNENYASLLSQLNAEYDITVYGSNRQVFRHNNIGYSRLDKIAAYINWEYNDNKAGCFSAVDYESQFKKSSEINKRSSRAAAVRTVYNLKEAGVECFINDAQNDSELSLKDVDGLLAATNLQELEHKRWSVFMTVNGWKAWKLISDDNYVSIAKYNRNIYKLPVAKLHGCLINNDLLDTVADISRSVGRINAFKNYDNTVVNASARALKFAYDNIDFSYDTNNNNF